MRNRIIDVYRIANRLVSITVEDPDFSELRVNQFVKIGDKEYRINSLPMINSTPPKSFFEMNTFAIDYTEDELMNKVAVFTLSDSQSQYVAQELQQSIRSMCQNVL